GGRPAPGGGRRRERAGGRWAHAEDHHRRHRPPRVARTAPASGCRSSRGGSPRRRERSLRRARGAGAPRARLRHRSAGARGEGGAMRRRALVALALALLAACEDTGARFAIVVRATHEGAPIAGVAISESGALVGETAGDGALHL